MARVFPATATVITVLTFCFSGALWSAQPGATPEEVVQKVRQAAQILSQEGEAGLKRFRSKDSEFVWKDTYVFVLNCDQQKLVAHPIEPKRVGSDTSDLPFGPALCDQARKPQGGWVEYEWPKPGEAEPSRKLSYVVTAKGTPYQVGAGVYDEKVTIEQLERISASGK